jgi:hypothetical protein
MKILRSFLTHTRNLQQAEVGAGDEAGSLCTLCTCQRHSRSRYGTQALVRPALIYPASQRGTPAPGGGGGQAHQKRGTTTRSLALGGVERVKIQMPPF